jgi:hypothetical protein
MAGTKRAKHQNRTPLCKNVRSVTHAAVDVCKAYTICNRKMYIEGRLNGERYSRPIYSQSVAAGLGRHVT